MLLQKFDLAEAIAGLVQGAFEPDCAFVARFGHGGRIDADFPCAGSELRTPSVSDPAEGEPAEKKSASKAASERCLTWSIP